MRKTIVQNDPKLIAAHVSEYMHRMNERRFAQIIYTTSVVIAEDMHGQQGYELAISEENEAGYFASGIFIGVDKYNDACDISDEVNAILFPERTAKENALIQLSSLRQSL